MAGRWTDVDEPVLRWVLAKPPILEQPSEIPEFPITEPEPFGEIDGLDTRQVSESLQRLLSHGLIAGGVQQMGRHTLWWQLRVTARGLQVLGEWPDLDRVASAISLRNVLRELAKDAPPHEQKALTRAGGLIGRAGGEAVREALSELASEATEQAIE